MAHLCRATWLHGCKHSRTHTQQYAQQFSQLPAFPCHWNTTCTSIFDILDKHESHSTAAASWGGLTTSAAINSAGNYTIDKPTSKRPGASRDCHTRFEVSSGRHVNARAHFEECRGPLGHFKHRPSHGLWRSRSAAGDHGRMGRSSNETHAQCSAGCRQGRPM